MFRIVFTTLISLCSVYAFGQVDSLIVAFDKASGQERFELAEKICIASNDTAIIREWSDLLISESHEQNDAYFEGLGYHYRAIYYSNSGNMALSILCHLNAIKLFESIGREDKIARQNLNLGNRYADMGLYDRALSRYSMGEKLARSANDTMALYGALLNISTIHHERGDKAKELEYLLKSRELMMLIGTEDDIALMHQNLAIYYVEDGQIAKANELADLSYAAFKRTNNTKGLAKMHELRAEIHFLANDSNNALVELDTAIVLYRKAGRILHVGNILLNQGSIMVHQERYAEGVERIDEAYNVFVEAGSQHLIAKALYAKNLYWQKTGNSTNAIKYLIEAIDIGEELSSRKDLINWYGDLAWIYYDNDQGQLAYEAAVKQVTLINSLHKENSDKAIAESEAKFQNEKKQIDIDRLELEKLSQDNALALERSRRNWVLIGLALAVLMVIAVGFAFLQKRRDNKLISIQKKQVERKNDLISEQKLLVDEKNKEITDSINYAKRIQEAILPESATWMKTLPKSMVLYMPKDIVAGDFFWLEETEEAIYLAAADCTGHGVPGAMVSVVCHNALNRALREYNLRETGIILDKVRSIVVETFLAETKDTIKDGMDIALCAIHKQKSDDEIRKIQFSGAHNALWIVSEKDYDLPIKSDDGSFKLFEVKADKQPVGKFEVEIPFTTHNLDLNKGDKIYMFSDGYADQFGGERGKKLKPAAMRNQMMQIHTHDFLQQQNSLRDHINNWRGTREQIDDICLIGVEL